MAQQEYVVLKNKTNYGMVALNKSVFQSIALITLQDESNIQLASFGNPFRDALQCKIQENQLCLEILINVPYNVNVNQVCMDLQTKIYENIKHMCEYAPDIIDIRVAGFEFAR